MKLKTMLAGGALALGMLAMPAPAHAAGVQLGVLGTVLLHQNGSAANDPAWGTFEVTVTRLSATEFTFDVVGTDDHLTVPTAANGAGIGKRQMSQFEVDFHDCIADPLNVASIDGTQHTAANPSYAGPTGTYSYGSGTRSFTPPVGAWAGTVLTNSAIFNAVENRFLAPYGANVLHTGVVTVVDPHVRYLNLKLQGEGFGNQYRFDLYDLGIQNCEVPEPASMTLAFGGLAPLALVALRRRFSKSSKEDEEEDETA